VFIVDTAFLAKDDLKMNKEQTTTATLRLPLSTLEWVKIQAKASYRSFNGEVLWILEEARKHDTERQKAWNEKRFTGGNQ
jgi:hypothetical protein